MLVPPLVLAALIPPALALYQQQLQQLYKLAFDQAEADFFKSWLT